MHAGGGGGETAGPATRGPGHDGPRRHRLAGDTASGRPSREPPSGQQQQRPPARQQQQQQQQPSLAQSATLAASYLVAGLKDSFAWPISLFVVYGSTTLKTRLLQCIFLNGVIFLGSILAFDHIVSPLARLAMVTLSRSLGFSDDIGSILRSLGSLITGLYYTAWVYPLYAASFFASSKWYQDIATRSFQIFVGETATPQVSLPKLIKNAVSDAYRGILIFNYMLQAALLSRIPYIGPVLSFALFNFVSSFFAFEYQWIHRGWSLNQQIEYFETHWIYFAGFGLPITMLTFFFPQTINLGLFALVFPMYIIMATRSRPVPSRKETHRPRWLPRRLPIFWLAQKTNVLLIGWIKRKRESIAATANASAASVYDPGSSGASATSIQSSSPP
ncbi:etoposide-induced protein 2.4-domain-containing protein [Entophlyctis helioformis]|nr:etoposide-induced protein 2.4-domain-containing protein [Entophlyctis helioformis]